MNKNKILLPGLDKQFGFLQENLTAKIESALVIGSSSEQPAVSISEEYSCNVDLIVEDYESLINSKLILEKYPNINTRMMEFDVTDFDDTAFDLIYAQGSVSRTSRNKYIKEIKRILKPDGFLCIGEIVALENNYPAFVKDIFDSSDLLPLFTNDLSKYYSERKFEIIAQEDLTNTLEEYYITNVSLLKEAKHHLSEQEKSYHKKLLNKISHESNVYLKLGGDRYYGFVSLLMKKAG
jgi:SAM-dependent methyltransferase